MGSPECEVALAARNEDAEELDQNACFQCEYGDVVEYCADMEVELERFDRAQPQVPLMDHWSNCICMKRRRI